MRRQIAAGLIIFRRTKEGLKFLFVYRGRGYWYFPKGKMEHDENSWDTALREVEEETGLQPDDLRIFRGFKVYDRYFFQYAQDKIAKLVIFFLAETGKLNIKISTEHEGYAWFTPDEAYKILKYKNAKMLLKKAIDFLSTVRQRTRSKSALKASGSF